MLPDNTSQNTFLAKVRRWPVNWFGSAMEEMPEGLRNQFHFFTDNSGHVYLGNATGTIISIYPYSFGNCRRIACLMLMQFNSATERMDGILFLQPVLLMIVMFPVEPEDPAATLFSRLFPVQIDFWSGHRHHQSHLTGCWREWRVPCQVHPNRQLVWAKNATLFVIILHQHLCLQCTDRIVTAMYTGQGHVSEHLFPNIRPMNFDSKLSYLKWKIPRSGSGNGRNE